MPVVGFEKCPRYDGDLLRRAISRAIEPLGGISAFVRKGDRVLIKPNLVAPAGPDSGICTHPLFVRAVCDAVAGAFPARIRVGDLPGYNYQGEGRRCVRESGLAEALEGGPAEIVPFEGGFTRVRAGTFRTYRHIDLVREVDEADVVISLPKPKTHRLTLYTGAIKNVFGCVSFGTRETIHKLGDFRAFCEGLVDIYSRVRPALTIADMIRVRQGNGPCEGTPLDLGLVLASADGVALDAVGQHLLGFASGEVLTTALARERGLGEDALDRIQVAGPGDWSEAAVAARRPGRFSSWANFGLPKSVFKSFAAAARVQPAFSSRKCGHCGLCVESCPESALSLGRRSVQRDKSACRLCFTCVAFCPNGAAVSRLDPFSAAIKRKAAKSLR